MKGESGDICPFCDEPVSVPIAYAEFEHDILHEKEIVRCHRACLEEEVEGMGFSSIEEYHKAYPISGWKGRR